MCTQLLARPQALSFVHLAAKKSRSSLLRVSTNWVDQHHLSSTYSLGAIIISVVAMAKEEELSLQWWCFLCPGTYSGILAASSSNQDLHEVVTVCYFMLIYPCFDECLASRSMGTARQKNFIPAYIVELSELYRMVSES